MIQTRERTVPTGVNFSIRMNSELKTQSEDLFRALGMNMTTAIQIFLKKAVSVGGLPFDVRVPNYNPETLEAMRETEEIGNAPDRRGMPLDLALAELKR
jgi:DNA-damage-inducible protein J